MTFLQPDTSSRLQSRVSTTDLRSVIEAQIRNNLNEKNSVRAEERSVISNTGWSKPISVRRKVRSSSSACGSRCFLSFSRLSFIIPTEIFILGKREWLTAVIWGGVWPAPQCTGHIRTETDALASGSTDARTHPPPKSNPSSLFVLFKVLDG